MEELEQREETYWHQRSCQNWLKYGDKNSNFFHIKANQRHERNHIEYIKDETGKKNEDETKITEVIATHFEKISIGHVASNAGMVVQLIKSSVSTAMAN